MLGPLVYLSSVEGMRQSDQLLIRNGDRLTVRNMCFVLT